MFLVGCIEPITLKPDIKGDILAFEVAGQNRVSLNAGARTINVELPAEADLTAVEITKLDLVQTAHSPLKVGDKIDLSSTYTLTVRTEASYEWRITGTLADPLPQVLGGGDFENWNMYMTSASSPKIVWEPWAVDAEFGKNRWWDSGNAGVTTLADSNTVPLEEGYAGHGAELKTIFKVKLAGGNIFFGRFGGMDGLTDAKIELGHQWKDKPRRLKGWYKYAPVQVNRTPNATYRNLWAQNVNEGVAVTADVMKTWMDSFSVIVALWADPSGEDKPFTASTRTSAFSDFLKATPGVIAWGRLTGNENVSTWTQMDIPIDYLQAEYSPDAAVQLPLPANTRLIVSITASKDCNYFIGGEGSTMWVDELELVY